MTSITIAGSNHDTNIIISSNSATITDATAAASALGQAETNLLDSPLLLKLLAENPSLVSNFQAFPFNHLSTFNMGNIDTRGAQYPCSLLAWLNKEIISNLGPTCPGISNVELVVQGLLKIESTSTFKVSEFNKDYNYFNKNFQEMLRIMQHILAIEKYLGVNNNGFLTNSKVTKTSTAYVLDLLYNPDVQNQYDSLGSFFMKPDVLQKYALSEGAKNAKLPTVSEAQSLIAEMDYYVDLNYLDSGYYATTIDGLGVESSPIDILGNIFKWLARGHLASLTMAKSIRDDPTYVMTDVSGTPFISSAADKKYWTPDAIFNNMLNYYLTNIASWSGDFNTAVSGFANAQLTSKYGLVEHLPDPNGNVSVKFSLTNEKIKNALNNYNYVPPTLPVPVKGMVDGDLMTDIVPYELLVVKNDASGQVAYTNFLGEITPDVSTNPYDPTVTTRWQLYSDASSNSIVCIRAFSDSSGGAVSAYDSYVAYISSLLNVPTTLLVDISYMRLDIYASPVNAHLINNWWTKNKNTFVTDGLGKNLSGETFDIYVNPIFKNQGYWSYPWKPSSYGPTTTCNAVELFYCNTDLEASNVVKDIGGMTAGSKNTTESFIVGSDKNVAFCYRRFKDASLYEAGLPTVQEISGGLGPLLANNGCYEFTVEVTMNGTSAEASTLKTKIETNNAVWLASGVTPKNTTVYTLDPNAIGRGIDFPVIYGV